MADVKKPGQGKSRAAVRAPRKRTTPGRIAKREKLPADAADRREAEYRAIIETSRDGFLGADREGRIVEVNEAYSLRSGYRREELLAMRIQDLEAKESPEETAVHIERIIREGSAHFETVHRTKEGTTWPVEVTITYTPDGGGHFYSFTRDISERKRAEAALRETWRFLEAVIDAAPT